MRAAQTDAPVAPSFAAGAVLLALAFGLLSSSGCLDDELDPALAGGGDATFIAFERDFQSFLGWPRTQVGAAEVVGGHDAGPRFAYVSAPPVAGKFPVGAMIAKTVESGDPTTWSIHAKAKRGGAFNPQGALGWEWFELRIVANSEVTILWRGAQPPKDHGYESLPGLGATSAMEGDCNTCHAAASTTDYVLSPVLDMQLGLGVAP
jgi:hypothetical protein